MPFTVGWTGSMGAVDQNAVLFPLKYSGYKVISFMCSLLASTSMENYRVGI